MPSGLTSKDIKLVERRGAHYYQVKGLSALLPSVTTVTGAVLAKPLLVPWAKKVALENVRAELLAASLDADPWNETVNTATQDGLKLKPEWIGGIIERAKKRPQELAEAAAEIGTAAHKIVDEMLKGDRPMSLDGIDPSLHRPVKGFLEWYPTCPFVIEKSEVRVASLELGVAGSMDSIGRRKDNGALVIIDVKTSKAIYNEMAYQIGGYAICAEEMWGEKIHEACIIRLPKYADDPVPFEQKSASSIEAAKAGFACAKALYDINKMDLLGQHGKFEHASAAATALRSGSARRRSGSSVLRDAT